MQWLPLLPPLVAIGFAIWQREVMMALILALFSAEFIRTGFAPLTAFSEVAERMVAQFQDAGNARVLLFSLMIGALIALVRETGGVAAFIEWIERKGWANTPRKASFLPIVVSCVLFIESNLSILTSAIVSMNLFDKHRMSRARLAYFVDSTCPPVKVLVLLNGWGAYLLGLLATNGSTDPVAQLAHSVPLNFYCWITLALVVYTAFSGRVYGSMRDSESRVTELLSEIPPATRKRYFLLPIAVLVFGILAVMFYTGSGNLMKGSGSSAVLWSTMAAIMVAYGLLRIDRQRSHGDLVQLAFKGMGELLPLVALVLLALALGDSLKQLGTGHVVTQLVGGVLPFWAVTSLVFLCGCLISFSTGTSWGTFALMMPIAMPLAPVYHLPPELLLSAVIGGGVFGDHCSGISDTAVLSSLASGCNHYEHVRTQLPYALVAAAATLILYIAVSLFMHGQ